VKENEIIVPVCWLNGGNMIDRDTLPSDHPESMYGYIKHSLKKRPEDYGIYPDLKKEEIKALEDREKSELVQIIIQQRELLAKH
jgi:hypothetical protein